MFWELILLRIITIVLTINSLSALGQVNQALDSSSPPTLGLNTYTTNCTKTMRREIMNLADEEATAEELEQSALQAKINIRRLAIELITQGDQAQTKGNLAVFNGLRFFHGRVFIDESLDGFVTLGSSLRAGDDELLLKEFAAANKELLQFNERLLNAPFEIPITNTMQLDGFIESLMLPLIPAVELVSIDTAANHWPTISNMQRDLDDDAAEKQHISADSLLKQIRLRFEEATLRDDTHDKFITIMDWLERGLQFPEFRHQIENYANLLLGVLKFSSTLEKASWLDASAKHILNERLHAATVLFEDRASRTVGQQHFTQLLKSRSVLVRISKLADRRIDIRAIGVVFEALLDSTDPDTIPEPVITRKLRLIVERMILFRELETPKLPREFRLVMRNLNEAYLIAEKHLLENLEKLTNDPDALVDPSISSLIADQKQYLEDLQRTAQLPQWISTLSQLTPKFAKSIEKQLQKLSKLLVDPNDRPGAIAALDKLGEQIRLFNPLPFESQIHSGNSAVIIMTGGRHRELITAITKSRIAWAQAWADGINTEETAKHMLLLYRFTQLQGDAAGILSIKDQPFILNRWAAWDLPANIIAQRSANLPTRLKLATAAAIDGDDLTLARQLDRIDREAPFAKLIGRLHQNLSQPLAELPDGALSVLGQTTTLPSDESWGIPMRIELARLCRYTLEHQHAQATGQAEIAISLEKFVNQIAGILLDEFNEKY